MDRKSGVLMHISSLFGDYSIGGFGEEAKYFIDFLADCGFSYWQVLPFCVADEYNSPYKSYSAFGGNPYFVDLKNLKEKGLITDEELLSQKQQTPYSCEYLRLYQERFDILLKASKRAKNTLEIESFIEEQQYLKKFCEFMSLKRANEERPWYKWERNEIDKEYLFMWKFIQYEFFMQWNEIKKYANERGIKIIGDIPIYVSHDSADVWSNPNLFLLDEENNPSKVAGVPPDYFTEDGQLWGNPIYNWAEMEKDNFKWWQDRISHMLTLFDGVRIDHFRGIEAYWAVDGRAETARDGKWEKGPGEKLINAIKEVADDKLIIAEDLGDITKEVIDLVEKSGFPGMRVFQFAFMGNEDNPHLPHNYPKNSVVYTGTHDNNTLLGYLWELSEWDRKRMLSYCGYDSEDFERGYDSILKTMFASHGGLLILPIQDLLGYGSDTRLNTPGKADGNWQYRITKEQLDSIDKNKFYKLNEMYKRL